MFQMLYIFPSIILTHIIQGSLTQKTTDRVIFNVDHKWLTAEEIKQ